MTHEAAKQSIRPQTENIEVGYHSKTFKKLSYLLTDAGVICSLFHPTIFYVLKEAPYKLFFSWQNGLALVLTAQSARAQEINNHRKLTQSRSRLSGELLQF